MNKKTSRKKILWLSHLIPYPPKGGVLQRAYNLVAETCKYNDVHLVTLTQNSLLKTHFGSIENGIEEAKKALEEICHQVTIFPIPQEEKAYGKYITAMKGLLSAGGYNVEWLKSKALANYLNNLPDEYDIIHFDTISLAPYLAYAKTAKTVLDHHNIESHMLLRRAENCTNPIKKAYFYKEGKKLETYEKSTCHKFDLNITCSDLDSERLQTLCPSARIKTIPNGVDINYFQPIKTRTAPSSQAPKLIFAGRLNAYTNKKAAEDIAFKIWPEIKQAYPKAEFILAGPNPPESITSVLGSDPQFHITGFVNDIRTCIDSADIYICPITDGGGTKLKILDALAMGIPIIADPIACEGIDVKNNKNVIFAKTPNEYVVAIKELMDNKEAYIAHSSNARQLAKNKYSFISIGENLNNNYSKISEL